MRSEGWLCARCCGGDPSASVCLDAWRAVARGVWRCSSDDTVTTYDSVVWDMCDCVAGLCTRRKQPVTFGFGIRLAAFAHCVCLGAVLVGCVGHGGSAVRVFTCSVYHRELFVVGLHWWLCVTRV